MLLATFFDTKLPISFCSPVAVLYPSYHLLTAPFYFNMPMSSALSSPIANLCSTFFFQCSFFPISCLYVHISNATSLLLCSDIQPLLLPFSVWETSGLCVDLKVLSPLEKQAQSTSNQVFKLRGNSRNGTESDLPQSDSLGTRITNSG